jgi:hypothetical protein
MYSSLGFIIIFVRIFGHFFQKDILLFLDSIQTEVQFDFLIRSQFLRTSLKKHIAQIDIPTERIVIEYIEKYIPPKADDCLTQDDWISTIATCGKWLVIYDYISVRIENYFKKLLYIIEMSIL